MIQQALNIKHLQKQGDQLKKQFETLENQFQHFQSEAPTSQELKGFHSKCQKFTSECQQLLEHSQTLKVDPTVRNYAGKLEEEKGRLQKLMSDVTQFVIVTNTPPSLRTDESGVPDISRNRSRDKLKAMTQDAERQLTQNTGSQQTPKPVPTLYDNPPKERDSQEESDEEDHEQRNPVGFVKPTLSQRKTRHARFEEEDIHIPAGGTASNTSYQPRERETFVALGDLLGKEPGDLSLHKGDVLRILATREDGWWQAINTKGEKGLIPSNYIQRMKISGTDASALTSSSTGPAIPHQYEDIPDESIQDHTQPVTVSERESEFGHQIWGGLRKQLRQISSSDVLEAMGAQPPGFRPSTLALLQREDPHLTLACHLIPRLSESNLGFHDLYWNIHADKLMKRHIRVLKCMRAIRCENIPTTEDLAGLEVQSRHIRICLFDGTQVISNIHTIRAQFNRRQPKTWKFLGDKLTDKESLAEHGDFFVRSNYAKKEVVLLIEVALSYLRTSSGERGELSCGWTTLPLLLDTGVDTRNKDKYVHYGHETVANKVYNLPLLGGTPFDKGVSLTSGTDKIGINPLKAAMSSSHQPILVLKVMAPNETQREHIDALPDVLIWNTLCAPFAYWFRRLAGEALIRNREDMQSAELIPDAFLSTFTYVAQEPDIMDVVRIVWNIKEQAIPKTDKKSEQLMARHFRDAYCTSGAILYNTLVVPTYSLLNAADIQLRKEAFESFLESYKLNKDPVSWLSGSVEKSLKFAPLDIFDLALNLTGPHCLD